jgi:hypothetical protein
LVELAFWSRPTSDHNWLKISARFLPPVTDAQSMRKKARRRPSLLPGCANNHLICLDVLVCLDGSVIPAVGNATASKRTDQRTDHLLLLGCGPRVSATRLLDEDFPATTIAATINLEHQATSPERRLTYVFSAPVQGLLFKPFGENYRREQWHREEGRGKRRRLAGVRL